MATNNQGLISIKRFNYDSPWNHAIYIVQQSCFPLIANLWLWTKNVDNFLNLLVNRLLRIGPKLFFCVLCTLLGPQAVASDWYLGIGAGVSMLEPADRDAVVAASSTRGTYAGFLLGRNLSDRFAGEAHLHLPGRGEVGESDVDYSAFDLTLRYQLLNFSAPRALGTEVFVLAGFGSVRRDIEGSVELENDTRFHFSFGAGVETQLNPSVSLRGQALYIDEDVQVANVSLIWHWGQTTGVDLPAPAGRNKVSSTVGDADADGIANASDQCDGSRAGFPVRENGCALFDGQLPGLVFEDRTSTLLSSAYTQLDALVTQLTSYPDSAVELIAHTDARGTLREQSILTRKRLRIIASYLSKNGIRANRLILKSMGGSQPAFDNKTVEGRTRNNRIEIFEHRP